MKQLNLNYIAGNSPHIAPLPDCETKAFFSALLASIKELSEEERKNNSFCLSAGGAFGLFFYKLIQVTSLFYYAIICI